MESGNKKTILTDKQQLMILTIFIVIFWGCLIKLLFSPPVYQVKASILIDEQGFSMGKLDQLLAFSGTKVNNIVQKLKSTTLLKNTLHKLNYNYQPGTEEFSKIEKRLIVRQVQASNAIEITFTHRSVKEATQIVNTLVETLMEEDLKELRGEVQKDLQSVEQSITEIRSQQLQLNSPIYKINSRSLEKYLKETTDDITRTKQILNQVKSTLAANQIEVVNNFITTRYLDKFKTNLVSSEKKLVANLLVGGWSSSNVQNYLKNIGREKAIAANFLKEDLAWQLNITGNEIINDICTYAIRLLDLEIRKQELQLLIPNKNQLPSSERQNQYETSLKELEEMLIKKQVTLQNLNDSSLTKINWIDKAVPVSSPFLHPSLYFIIGFSLIAAFTAAVIIGLFLVEYNLSRQNVIMSNNSSTISEEKDE